MLTPIINQNGPLPISVNFAPEVTGPAALIVAGSVWSQTRNTMIGIRIAFDGNVVGTAQIWSNAPGTHRAVVTQHIQVELDKDWGPSGQPASYNVTLAPMNPETIGDSNDIYAATLMD